MTSKSCRAMREMDDRRTAVTGMPKRRSRTKRAHPADCAWAGSSQASSTRGAFSASTLPLPSEMPES